MLLDIGKFTIIRRIFITFKRQGGIHLKNNFTYISRNYLLFDKPSRERSLSEVVKKLQAKPLHSSNCLKFSENLEGNLDKLTFDSVCAETLDSLTEYFEELVESVPHFKNADVTYSDGVLTVHLGKSYGTYVINRQSPNLQIWLSSPISGPKRYDFVGGTWVYKHDKTTLHSLLDREIKDIINQEVEFVEKCLHAKAKA